MEIWITGAGGRIGTILRKHWSGTQQFAGFDSKPYTTRKRTTIRKEKPMPTLYELRKTIIAHVEKTCADFDYNHDYQHHIRFVARDAERLAQAEGADPDICWTAAMLHELGLKGGRKGHDERGPEVARDFLRSIGTPPDTVRSVVEVLRVHHNHAAVRSASTEAQCVHDANELHTVGPNGFLRVFSDMIHVLDNLPRHEAISRLEDQYLERRLEMFQTRAGRERAEEDMALLRKFIWRYHAYERL